MSAIKVRKGQLSVGSRDHTNPLEIWGLTGGIASGKSTAAQFFSEAGVLVVDADKVAHELSAPGGIAYAALLKRFGTADRSRLRELIFSDATAKRDLEAIMHPLIQAESMRRIQASGATCAIYEAALLVETGRHKSFSGLIVVDAPRELRKRRLIWRDKMSEEMAEKILNAQVSDDERKAAATVIFTNDGAREDLRKQVQEFVHTRGWN